MFSKPKCSIWHFNDHYLKSGFITIALNRNHFYIKREQNKRNYPAHTCAAAVVKYSVGVSIYIYIYTVFPRFSHGLFYSSYILVARYSRARVNEGTPNFLESPISLDQPEHARY